MILNPYAIVIDAYVTLGGIKPSASSYADHKAYINASGQAAYITALEGIFAGKTNADMATTVLTNLGLTAAFTAAQGEAYFAANAGSRVQAALSLTSALANYSGTDTVLVAAKTTHNQVASNAYAYASVATNTVDSAVSATSSNTGQTFTLTTSTDALSGTVADDSFNGVLQGAAVTGTTVQPGDVINGGDGVDTLTISVAGAGGADVTISALSTNSIEKFVLSNFDTSAGGDDTIIQAGLMTGLTTVGLSSSGGDGDTIFNGLKNMVDAEMRNGSADLTITYDGSQVVTGTADVQNVTVSALTGGAFVADGIETVNVTSELSKSSAVSFASNALKTLSIAGAADLTLGTAVSFAATANGTAIDGTIDASTFTGKLSLDAGGTTSTVKVTGGSANDTIAMAGTLTKNDVIDGGDGVDTVSITGHNGATVLKLSTLQMTNVEEFKVTGAAGAVTSLDTDGGAISTVTLVENGTTSIDATVAGLTSGSTVNIENINGGDAGVVTASLKDAAGTSDVLNFGLKVTSGDGAEAVEQIIATNVETINLKSGAATATATVAGDSVTVTNQSYASATNLNISGDTALTFTNAIVGTKLKTIDAADMTAGLSMTAAAVDLNLKTGSGADTLTFGTTLTAADVIDAGGNPSATVVDTLSATVNALGTTEAHAKLSIANVEEITLNTATAASFVDASGITGATTIKVENDQNVTISNLAAGTNVMLGTLATKAVSTVDEYTGTLEVALADETGDADTLTAVLGATDGNNDINATLKTGASLETLTIQASTDATTSNDVTLNVTNVKSGTIALTKGVATETVALGTVNAGTKTINAAAFDGLLSVTASASDTAITIKKGLVGNAVTGGAGNDTVTILDLGGDDANGAGGTDILNATIKGDLTEATQNFETVNYTIGNNVQATVTGADGLGVDASKTFNLLGGDALTTFAIDYVSPAALTKIDMGGFTGLTTQSTFAASQLKNTIAVVGSAGTDTVIATTNNDNAAVLSMSGVETLKLNVAGGATAFDFSKTSGITKVQLDDDGTARIATLTDLAEGALVEVEHGITASGVVIDLVNKTDAANTQTVEIKTTATDTHTYSISADDIEAMTIKMSDASTLDLSALSMVTAGKTSSLTFTGNKVATISALHADVTSIDAAAMTQGGAVVQSARSQTTATDVKGSLGNDTFIMSHTGDVMVGGAGTDTLTISKSAILGGLNVDLSAADEQILSFNGSATSGTVTGFENVDASGYTGTFGAQITAIKTGSTITGTANADQITGGAGNDTINVTSTAASASDVMDGGAGTGDTINIVATTDFADTDGNIVNIENVTIGAGSVNVDLTAQTEAFTITGGTGANAITGGGGNDTITGGDGVDTLDGGAGADTYVFAATGALNDNDVFGDNIVGGVGGDILDFRAMGTFTLLSATATEHDGTAGTAIANKVVLLASADGGVTAVDSAIKVAALIEGTGDAMELASGGKAIIIAGDDSAATAGALIYLVDDTLGAVAGTISADDIVIIGNMTLDIDTILTGNLLLA